MSGRSRLALSSTLATLLAACALLPLVTPVTWYLQAVLLVAIQTGVGAATRRVPLARPLTVASQTLVTLMLLTLAFAREQALLGIVPTPDTFRHFAELLTAGADDVGRYSTPAPLSPGIRLMLVGGVLVIGLLVDALAVTFRSAAPAGLPLLALYSVAAGLSADGDWSWVWFLLAAGGYLLLLLTEGRDRLSQWGRVFGGGPRGGGLEPAGGAVAPIRTGRRVGAMALVIAALAPYALPTLSGGLLDGTGAGVGSGSGSGGTISAVNPLVSLRDSLNVDQDREVISYRTNTENKQDMYLRIVSLDDFDGTAWKPAVRHITDVPKSFPAPPGLNGEVRRTEVRTSISAAKGYAQDWLPMPYPVNGVKIKGSWRYEPVGRTLVGDHGQTTSGVSYEVSSLIVQPTAEQLADAPEPSVALKREFTKVPRSLPGVVARTARQVTEGSTNNYERAVKLQDWFAGSGGFTYDTQVQVGSGSQAIARFLKDKEGFCVHFSFAMAAMARTLGIPARVAVGFTPGTEQSDGTMSVGLRDAHAWPELYFEGVGWTRFEPTPSRGTTPEYTRSDTSSAEVGAPSAPSQSASQAPSAAPSASKSCSTDAKELQACQSESPTAAFGVTKNGTPWLLIFGLVVGGLAVLALPMLPMMWRIRARAQRLGAHGRSEADAAAHTLAVWLEATDTAWDYGIAPEESLTPRKAAARIVRLGRLDEAAAASVHRVAAAVEQVLYAPRPQLTPGLAEDVRGLPDALGASVSRVTRLRARFAPRSAVRVIWLMSDRWVALSVRWTRWTAKRPALWQRLSRQGG